MELQKDHELAKKIFHDILMDEYAERNKTTLNELIGVAQEIIAEFDQQTQNRTIHDEMGFGEVNELPGWCC